MRSWEKKDITDILIKHHEELRASIPEDDAEQVKPIWTEVDDDCIVIESFLEEDFGIWWDGLKFRRPKERIERMKGRSLKDYANYHKNKKSWQITKINPENIECPAFIYIEGEGGEL